MGSLCDCFERHPESPIRDVQRSTAESYADSLKVIRATVAKRAVRALTPIDIKAWYRKWRAPSEDGKAERVKRAHDAVSALRMILGFGLALGYEECGALAIGLSKIRFERSAPREGAMTVEHARAFIRTALARDDSRGLMMAIGVATQFETMLRQKDVIGQWMTDSAGREGWSGPYRWDNIPGGIFRLKTSKTGAQIEHDLTGLELLWPLSAARAPGRSTWRHCQSIRRADSDALIPQMVSRDRGLGRPAELGLEHGRARRRDHRSFRGGRGGDRGSARRHPHQPDHDCPLRPQGGRRPALGRGGAESRKKNSEPVDLQSGRY